MDMFENIAPAQATALSRFLSGNTQGTGAAPAGGLNIVDRVGSFLSSQGATPDPVLRQAAMRLLLSQGLRLPTARGDVRTSQAENLEGSDFTRSLTQMYP